MDEIRYLSAPLSLAPGPDGTLPGRFSGVSYSGAFIPGYDFVVDLAETTVAPDLPVLFQHDHAALIGMVTRAENTGQELRVDGELFADIDPVAAQVAAKAKRGAKYQQSMGLYGGHFTRLEAETSINGRPFAAGVEVLRGAEVREVSIVALGADKNTSAHVFKPNQESRPVADQTQTINDLTAQLDAMRGQVQALTSERDTLQGRVAELEGQVQAQRQATRLSAVRELFAGIGREFSEDAARPYAAMSDEAFAAVSADLRAMLQVRGAGMFQELAVDGRSPGSAGDDAPGALTASVRSRFGLPA